MIYAAPSATFTAVAEGFSSGLTGTITVQIERGDGTTHTAPTSTGIVEIEANSGTYVKTDLVAPSTRGTYIVLWHNGSGTYASEELNVTTDVAATAPAPTGSEYTFGKLRSKMDDLAGIDIDDDQRDDLLNEAHRELAVRSEWFRATIDVTGVADQAAYSLPADVYRVLNLRVDGEAYKPMYEQQADRIARGIDTLLVAGIYWMSWSASNERQVSIYPTVADDAEITMLVIERPPLMDDDDDTIVVPDEFGQAIVDRAAGLALGMSEDNPDLRSYHEDLFNQKIGELRRLTYSTGRDVVFWGAA